MVHLAQGTATGPQYSGLESEQRGANAMSTSAGTEGPENNRTSPTEENENPKEPDERFVWRHVKKAQETVKGENQLAEYVARLEIAECARILAASPIALPSLAALRDECRVGPEEKRSFEEVIKAWTLEVLSGTEGG
jgi:hypothetical protein